ncbi:hypothetical protein M6D81_28210, partial [Paenibacillus sp. J5C_2022]|uniref:hypothetical protein n=1 Tax=Paenibacillus sp. J5C2022 TaxID=2977129 RepID=UPI0021D10A50
SAAFVRNFIQTGSIRRHISGFCMKFHTNRQYSAALQRLLYEISYKPAVFGDTSAAFVRNFIQTGSIRQHFSDHRNDFMRNPA